MHEEQHVQFVRLYHGAYAALERPLGRLADSARRPRPGLDQRGVDVRGRGARGLRARGIGNIIGLGVRVWG